LERVFPSFAWRAGGKGGVKGRGPPGGRGAEIISVWEKKCYTESKGGGGSPSLMHDRMPGMKGGELQGEGVTRCLEDGVSAKKAKKRGAGRNTRRGISWSGRGEKVCRRVKGKGVEVISWGLKREGAEKGDFGEGKDTGKLGNCS